MLENKHFGMDMPRGHPRKNFGLKNFGLIFLWGAQMGTEQKGTPNYAIFGAFLTF